MKQLSFLIASFLFCLGFSVKAQNVVYDSNAEVRKVGSFTGVEVSGGITLYLSQGTEQAVAISASDEKYLPHIKTEVRNGLLKIYAESGVWNKFNWGNRQIKAYVTVTTLEVLDISGASTARVTGDLNVNDISIEVSGASTLKTTIKGRKLKLEVSGASAATLEGTMDESTIEVSGASSLKAYDLVVNTCKAEASGASGMSITVNKQLDAEASGASSIGYRGAATITRVDASGASSIRRKD